MLKDVAAKKMVTPAARREAVAHLRSSFDVSERRACGALGADEARFAIAPDDLVMRLRGSDCASLQRFAVASVIAACLC